MSAFYPGQRVLASDPRAGAIREPATIRRTHIPTSLAPWYSVGFDSVPKRQFGVFADHIEPMGYAALDGLAVRVC